MDSFIKLTYYKNIYKMNHFFQYLLITYFEYLDQVRRSAGKNQPCDIFCNAYQLKVRYS